MKVNPLHSVNAYRKAQEVSGKRMSDVSQKRDEVQISLEAKKMQESSQMVLDQREKVAQVKEKVEQGEYKVNPQEVARKFYEFWSE